MPLLELKNIAQSFGLEVILEDLSGHLERGERVGLVGGNGSGKTTLLRIIARDLEPDQGQVIQARNIEVGYLTQEPELDSDRTAYEEAVTAFADLRELEVRLVQASEAMAAPEALASPGVLERRMEQHARLLQEFESRGGYDYEARTKSVLAGLGFDHREMNLPVGHLSGGQKSRLALAKLLLRGCDLLLLDEPTNHLDIRMTEWLEEFLLGFSGAVLAVSHDRTFLNHVAQKILELEQHRLTEYYYGEKDSKLPPGAHQFLTLEEARPEDYGAYSHYLLVKRQQRAIQQHAYEGQQRGIRRLEDYIRVQRQRGDMRSARSARSREKLLEKMDRREKPPPELARMRLHFTPASRGGNDIVRLDGVSKRYGDKVLFENVNLFIRRLERVGIVGPNGCGKTTLLRLILGQEEPTSGRVQTGSTLTIGYFRQEHPDIDLNLSPMEEIRRMKPEWQPGQVRDFLALFLFFGDDVFRPLRDFSGGERVRLALAKLLLQAPNFLVLDEPTNHLDIASRMVLEEALQEFPGTILVVSHDRYFLDRICRRLLVFEDSGTRVFEGNYRDYKAFLRREQQAAEDAAAREREAARQARQRAEREKTGRKREAPAGPTLEEVEEQIGRLENELSILNQVLTRPELYVNAEKVKQTLTEQRRLERDIAALYEIWEGLAETAE